MAVVGQALTAPETGWQRYDDRANGIQWVGSWTSQATPKSGSDSSAYGGTFSYMNTAGSYYKFKMKGTKFRIITATNTSAYRCDSVDVYVDDVKVGSYTDITASIIYQRLSFEYSGMIDGEHTIKLVGIGIDSSKGFILDAVDIDATGSLITPLGIALTAPEAGWQRFDDGNGKISYASGWGRMSTSNATDGYYSYITGNNTAKAKIKFKGTKFRLISTIATSGTIQGKISIDGNIETFSCYGASAVYQAFVYEKTGLSDDIHTIEIWNGDSSASLYIWLDAIDIDSTGYLVAPIGAMLTTPETGWKRFDDNDKRITYTGANWATGSNSSCYNSTYYQNNVAGQKLTFKFYGTKVRIIGISTGAYSNGHTVTIDGVSDGVINGNNTGVFQALVYEKTGLNLDTHTLEITVVNTGYFLLDAIDVDSDGSLVASIGQQSLTPDAGWNRFEIKPNLGNIKLVGTWNYTTDNGSNGDRAWGTAPCSYTFKFKGTKLRIVCGTYSSRSSAIKVIIDGVTETYSGVSSEKYAILLYEKTGLSDTVHSVEVRADDKYMDYDAIDTDGYLVHPFLNQVSKIEDMKYGDCISARYKASVSGAIGTISEVGICVMNEILLTSSATPDGMFYFIHAGYDSKGRLKLIADRNIQNSISWDTLNTNGITSGEGLPIKLFNQGDSRNDLLTVSERLLSGGIVNTDKDNEWDKIIVESTLGGKITAGDSNIWHPTSNWSLTSTSLGATPANKVVRGGTTIGAFSSIATSDVTSGNTGFRPVIIVSIENTPPKITLDTVASETKSSTVSITGTISDTEKNKFRYKIDNGAWSNLVSGDIQIQYTKALVLGINTITITAEDEYGLQTIKTITITRTNTAPDFIVVSEFKRFSILENLIISTTISDTDEGSILYYKIENLTKGVILKDYDSVGSTSPLVINESIPIDSTNFSIGANLIRITAKDDVGATLSKTIRVFVSEVGYMTYQKSFETKDITLPNDFNSIMVSSQYSGNIAVAYSIDSGITWNFTDLDSLISLPTPINKMKLRFLMDSGAEVKAYGLGWL